MPDLGRLLREDFDLVLSCVHWITAWSIRNKDLKSSSIPFLKKMAEISGEVHQFPGGIRGTLANAHRSILLAGLSSEPAKLSCEWRAIPVYLHQATSG
ncbi:hypothetical protein G4B88_000923 [Cannabis sativa]|uniref:Uncharacterized protein n=1 Tax=Cannabis sativa TaxID=3483 RepID=A0A7J6E3A2_CANSA|nr:hypothetical protein G4B88_000923 [Cannabis sativa]